MHGMDRLRQVGVSLLAALLLTLAWVLPALADFDDGDGFDGDELLVPLVLIAAGVVVAWAVFRRRRGGTPSSGA